jgi:FkbM family methyltransferase
MSNIYCNNLALSEKAGVQTFYKTQGEASSSLLPSAKSGTFVDHHTVLSETYEVKVDSLDNYAAANKINRIDILKMDVQGYELHVLQGAKDILSQQKVDLIYSEIWFTAAYQGQALYEDIALYLRNFGYCTFGIYNTHWDTAIHGRNLWGDAIFVKQ